MSASRGRGPGGPRVRVKVCGMRSEADLLAARGADALGFVVASPTSRRNLEPPVAAKLARLAPPFVQTVLVTRETHPAKLAALHGAVPTDALQVHGLRDATEAAAVRKAVGAKLLLAVDVGEGAEALARAFEPYADGIHLDSRSPAGESGGSGQTHDWRVSARIARALAKPVILAGGLTPRNVAGAVRQVKPYGVDVSGGVEGPKGKSRAKVEAFLEAVHG